MWHHVNKEAEFLIQPPAPYAPCGTLKLHTSAAQALHQITWYEQNRPNQGKFKATKHTNVTLCNA